jgi:predicted secreted protein
LTDVNGAKIFAAQNFGTWKVIFQRDGEIGGVFDADDGDQARLFVEKYLDGQIK